MDEQNSQKWSFRMSTVSRSNYFNIFRLNPKDIVIEYVGEKIREPVGNHREIVYEKIGVGDCYLF